MGNAQIALQILPSIVAICIALGVTARFSAAALRKDLFEHRYGVFKDVDAFISALLRDSTASRLESDEWRRFRETLQRAEMLFGTDVRSYLEKVKLSSEKLSDVRMKMARDPGDIDGPQEQETLLKSLYSLYSQRSVVFRHELAIETFGMGSVRWIVCFATGLIAGAFVMSIWPIHSNVHRVLVTYPSRWDAGEFRNCALGKPHYPSDRWPEFLCDGVGSHGDAIKGSHAFAMDVQFSGQYKVPTDKHVEMWTCQSLSGGELVCKDWQ